MTSEEDNLKEYYKSLWRDHSVEAQIKLVKNEAEANYATLIFHAIRDDLEAPDVDLEKLGNGNILSSAFKKLKNLAFISDATLMNLLKDPKQVRKWEDLVKKDLNGTVSERQLINFVKELFEDEILQPLSKKVTDKLAETYQNNIFKFRERNSYIENKIKNILGGEYEGISINQRQIESLQDRSVQKDLSSFLENFRRFRLSGGSVPIPNTRAATQLVLELIPELKEVDISQYKDPYNIQINAMGEALQARRKEEGNWKGDSTIFIQAIHNGPKPYESALRKVSETKKGDYTQIKDIARTRNLHNKPNVARRNNEFSRFFAERNGFAIIEVDSRCKGQKSGSAFSKSIYAIPVGELKKGEKQKYILGEVQNYHQIEHKLDKDITHELFEISRRMYGKGRKLSTDHLTLGDVIEIYDEALIVIKKLKEEKYEYFKSHLNKTPSDALYELAISDIEELVKLEEGVIKKRNNLFDKTYDQPVFFPLTAKLEDLKEFESHYFLRGAFTSDIDASLKDIAKKCEDLHFSATMVAKSNAPFPDRVLNYKLIRTAFRDKDGIISEFNENILKELLHGAENISNDEFEKLFKDAEKYIAHFSPGKAKGKKFIHGTRNANPNIKEYVKASIAKDLSILNQSI